MVKEYLQAPDGARRYRDFVSTNFSNGNQVPTKRCTFGYKDI